MVDKITNPPSQKDLIDKVNELVDDKQDVLTSENAGTDISITAGTQDVLLSGVSPLALTNALGLNYIKALGATEQSSTPTPDNPVDIVCNNGVLKVHNKRVLPLEYQAVEYLESTGTQYINTGVQLDDTMTIRIKYDYLRAGFVFGSRASNIYRYSGITNESRGNYNIRYGNALIYTQETIPSGTVDVVISPNSVVLNGETVSTTAYGNSFYAGNCFLFTTNNSGRPQTGEYAVNRIRRFTIDNVIDLIPCRRKSDNVLGMYDLVNNTFLTNAGTGDFIAGADVADTEIYADGTQETVNITNGGTANAEMLLKVGNNQDNQELLTGNITRNVGIKVLDGTEDWIKTASSRKYCSLSKTEFPNAITTSSNVICSHAVGTGYDTQGYCYLGNSYFNFNYLNATDDLDDFKEFLATQYANGTPVIVVYPLATSTTETVTGQSLTASGNCTVTATGSLNNLELEANYKSETGALLISFSNTTGYATESYVTAAVSGKQDSLVSGTNIKTINNQSILGSGNIDIQGGGSSYTAGDGIDITNNVISVTSAISTGAALGATAIQPSALNGYATQAWVGQQGYITGITSSDVTTALGYTPYNSSNPNGYITSSALTPYVLSADLAIVATSGSYNDLSDKPTIPSAVTEATVSGWGFTKNTGTVTSVNNVSPVNGNVTLSIPTVPTNISAFTNDSGYITNSALTPYALSADLASVATSGSYNDLSDKPTIPAAQVNSDWNATSGVAQILNKPTIPTVNNATLTIQKNGTNVATFTANASSNVTANISVPNTVSSVSSSSTNADAVGAKLFYDTVGDIETALHTINSGS